MMKTRAARAVAHGIYPMTPAIILYRKPHGPFYERRVDLRDDRILSELRAELMSAPKKRGGAHVVAITTPHETYPALSKLNDRELRELGRAMFRHMIGERARRKHLPATFDPGGEPHGR